MSDEKRSGGAKRKTGNAAMAVCFFLAALVYILTVWYIRRFDTSFAGLLFTLLTPIKGVGGGFWSDFLTGILPPVAVSCAAYLLVLWLTRGKRAEGWLERRAPRFAKLAKARKITGKLLPWITVLCFTGAVVHGYVRLNVGDYLASAGAQTQIYEEKYTDPGSVAIIPPEKKPNLIWLLLESMETTYASEEAGGAQKENYMPGLTAIARENVSFSDSDKLGGFCSTNNTNWTMAAIFAGTSGLPFAFPVDQHAMNKYGVFAPKVTALGDILQRDGYRQEFLCGSDGTYGGRALYFREHGDYEIHDLFAARERGEIPSDYYVWWGFEDRVLFRIAKEELTRLAAEEQPFNLTLLTVDAHHLGGYTCEECGDEFEDRTANVIACTDRQVNEFVEWCREQPFWDNTVLVITGDHPRMDTCLTEGLSFRQRKIYNAFLNARKEPAGKTENREAVTMDLFPTVLSAMGYEIPGDRLGLGTDLFSGRKTLTEEMGYEELNEEVSKYSKYFIDHFARTK